MKSGMRGAVVVVAICSWFAISNHCAFGALATRIDSAQTGCPFHSKPKQKQSTAGQCCKVLRAVASVATKSWARDDSKSCGVERYDGTRVLPILYSQRTFVPLCLDTGPPDANSFVELVLQQSLLAHAPPVLA